MHYQQQDTAGEGTCGGVHHAASAPDAKGALRKRGQNASHWYEAVLLLTHGLDFDAQVRHPGKKHVMQSRAR